MGRCRFDRLDSRCGHDAAVYDFRTQLTSQCRDSLSIVGRLTLRLAQLALSSHAHDELAPNKSLGGQSRARRPLCIGLLGFRAREAASNRGDDAPANKGLVKRRGIKCASCGIAVAITLRMSQAPARFDGPRQPHVRRGCFVDHVDRFAVASPVKLRIRRVVRRNLLSVRH